MADSRRGLGPMAVIMVASLALLAGIALALLIQRGGDTTSSQSGTGDLLVVSSATGALVSNENGDAALVLADVDPQTLWFTDRPQRLAGVMPTAALVTSWPGYFASSAPNAAFTFRSGAQASTPAAPIPVELGVPEDRDGSLSFPLTVLDGASLPQAGTSIEGVHLFIDPPSARLTDFHEVPMPAPEPDPVPPIGLPGTGAGAPTVYIGGLPAAEVGDKGVVVGPPSSIADGRQEIGIAPAEPDPSLSLSPLPEPAED